MVKYGFPIGSMRYAVAKVHFSTMRQSPPNLAGTPDYSDISIKEAYGGCPPATARSVHSKAIWCPDGQAGIRNEVWVIPTVGCVNGIVKAYCRGS